MKYVLDFDRVIFDTEQLYHRLEQIGKQDLIGTVESLAALGDVTQLVFPDAKVFFQQHDRLDIVVLSSCHGFSKDWELAYQEEKIKLSGIGKYVSDVRIVQKEKTNVIAELSSQYDQITFIDDMEKHLYSVKCLGLKNVLLVRRINDQCNDNSMFPTITSLLDLDAIIKEI